MTSALGESRTLGAMTIRTVVVVAALVAAGGLASADPEPEPAPRERVGLELGGGLWGGNISCNGSDCSGFRAAGGLSGHIGYNFSERLGALVDLWAMTSNKDNASITFVTATIDLRLWLAPQVWVQGGLGNGHAVISVLGFSGRGDDVPVAELAAGLELVRHRSYALSVAAKLAQGTSAGDNSSGAQTGRMVGLGAELTFFSH